MNLKGRNKISPEFNMSSMTDIVFLLLIFFMIASTLAKNLDTINVKLPKAKGKSENRNSISLTINNNSQFYLDSKQIARRKIEQVLIAKLKGSIAPTVVLRAEEKVPIDQVVYVMNIANQNSIRVVLAVDAP